MTTTVPDERPVVKRSPWKLKLLIIEDNEQYAVLVRRMLARSVRFTAEFSGAETLAGGLEKLRHEAFDLVLLDLTLPDSHGLHTFSTIADQAGPTPIVVMTALDDQAQAQETVQCGAQDYLVKDGIDPRSLERAVIYAVERGKVQQQLHEANEALEKRVAERTRDLTLANEELQKQVRERKRAEELLVITQKQVIERERLHALGRMAVGIAHDFNNSLSPILGFAELLLRSPENFSDTEKSRRYVEKIYASAQQSAAIVSRLREFYRFRGDGEMFLPVFINDLIENVILLTQPRWKGEALAKGIHITIVTELEDVPTVSGNEAELREMLTNLVFNAIDAITDEGRITIRTVQRDQSVYVEIGDTGGGMPEEIRAHCFEPFFSTKREHGTGLGLGIVHGIVRRHEGEISVESVVGEGTTVNVALPVYHEQTPAEQAVAKPETPRKFRVLVVEDEPLVREVITMFLSEDSHEIDTAEDGAQGLEKFKAGAFDLVLTDRSMPEMNGDQLALEIKKLQPSVPIVLLTGFGDLISASGEKIEGIDMVVTKPFTMETLRGAIADAARLIQARTPSSAA
ncbi:MAG: response regulator [Verrucomicrobiota bacterium]|nr:response regulator [Verrucomicrobiota bacterium]